MKRFVWLPGMFGPEPQVWHHPNVGIDGATGKPRKKPLRVVNLTPEDEALSLADLAAKYPLPEN